MKMRLTIAAWAAMAMFTAHHAAGQKVIDRIAARVDDDVILLSDIRELGEYQQLVNGKAEGDGQLLDRLIDQWIVRKEAEAARFAHPLKEDVERSLERLTKSFATPQDYEQRRNQAGLTEEEVRSLVESQLYLNSYLDSRFRPLVRVDQKAIDDFYKNRVVPQAKERGQTPPTIEEARDTIREALIQQGIDEQTDRWLKESRARVQVQKFLGENGT